jgi:hypothetical protein
LPAAFSQAQVDAAVYALAVIENIGQNVTKLANVLELDWSLDIPKAFAAVIPTIVFAAKSAGPGSPPFARFAG